MTSFGAGDGEAVDTNTGMDANTARGAARHVVVCYQGGRWEWMSRVWSRGDGEAVDNVRWHGQSQEQIRRRTNHPEHKKNTQMLKGRMRMAKWNISLITSNTMAGAEHLVFFNDE